MTSPYAKSAPSSPSARKAPSPARRSGKTPLNRASPSTWQRSSGARRQAVRAHGRRREADAGGLSLLQELRRRRSAHSSTPPNRRARSPAKSPANLRIGLMPTFTRAVLAPVLDDFVPRCPEVRLHIVEGYSNLLTEMVLDDELDFAVVPAFEGTIGLKSRLLVRDREMLISGHAPALTPLAPFRLAECQPLKIVVPGPDNIRRRNLDTYFQSHGVEVEQQTGNGCHDRHSRIRRPLGLGDDAAERDLGERHRPWRIDRQPLGRARASRRIRGDPADAAGAVDAGPPFPAAL